MLTGPTAVGKSGVALEVARRIHAEIVSADSRQIYRYMDVGTAKPTAAERAGVTHHLIDVAYPNERFSVVDYRRMGDTTLTRIAAAGRPALIVGGSPHYLQALVDRLQPTSGNALLRAWLTRADATNPPEVLDAWLRGVDPVAYGKIERRNRRRVLRAIEVTLTEGRPFSFAGRQKSASLPAVWIGLHLDRPDLHGRVTERLEAMIQAGWIDEVRMLLAMGYAATLPALSATGYSQIAGVVTGELTLDGALTSIRHATHAFIRRQETWLRAERRIHWLNADAPDLIDQVLAAIATDPVS
ncbi:MAG: tRNA ((37)-N6)-dimethylallyltransferase MiaA [Chloroflexi bacterium]|nr:tRNA ((37)-N6)-dimethylallyltransferase MiaA [Chloroflexota bacterium]